MITTVSINIFCYYWPLVIFHRTSCENAPDLTSHAHTRLHASHATHAIRTTHAIHASVYKPRHHVMFDLFAPLAPAVQFTHTHTLIPTHSRVHTNTRAPPHTKRNSLDYDISALPTLQHPHTYTYTHLNAWIDMRSRGCMCLAFLCVISYSRVYASLGDACSITSNPLSARQTDVVLRLSTLVPPRVQLCTGDPLALAGMALRTVVFGRVLDQRCRPVSDAVVTLLQRDSSGQFRPTSHCSGVTSSDRNGVFAFTTVKPGKSVTNDSWSFRVSVESRGRQPLVTAISTNSVVSPQRNSLSDYPVMGELQLDIVLPATVTGQLDADDDDVGDYAGDIASRDRRSWSNSEWLKRRLVPYADWDTPASLAWQRKRGWGSQDIAWLKKRRRRRRKRAIKTPEEYKNPADPHGSGTMDAASHNRIQKWLTMLKAEAHRKKWNSDSGMSWIKRDAIAPLWQNAQQKKWNDAGVAWIKRANLKKKWAKDSGMSWIKRDQPAKKWAKDSGMSWIKRDGMAKKWAKESGMSWIKRNYPEKKWAKDSGMSWIKRSNSEKKWAKDSGMSWIKRSNPEKKWAKDSGMSWIKRGNPEKKWAKDSGMSWIKRGNPEKKWAKDSGMSWIKRDKPEKKWAKDSGMSWIKRGNPEKKWAKDSGMSWIKKKSSNIEPTKLSITTLKP